MPSARGYAATCGVLARYLARVDECDFDAVVRNGSALVKLQQANGDPVGSALPCVIGAFTVDHTPITCALPTDTKIASFNRIGLTVSE